VKLDSFLLDPLAAEMYAERFVNDGSPSGFSFKNTTSEWTSPIGPVRTFSPLILRGAVEDFRDFGTLNTDDLEPSYRQRDWIFVHPDMRVALEKELVEVEADPFYAASPTSSGRTVRLINHPKKDYVKLSYAGILGRIDRALPVIKAIAGPETSIILKDAANRGLLPASLGFHEEPLARIWRPGDSAWSMVWRSGVPTFCDARKYLACVPIFSLFSKDRLNPQDPSLLSQLIEVSGTDPATYLLENLIAPILEAYFFLIAELGLQPEWNSQNLMVLLGENLEVLGISMRDLESVDKDLTIMESLGLPAVFESFPYKCIANSQYNYQIKHSFMFDFKLGACVFEPLLEVLVDKSRRAGVVVEIRRLVSLLSRTLPEDFFPASSWFSFADVPYDTNGPTRPYVENPCPTYRSTR
jgi:hypothetical protein